MRLLALLTTLFVAGGAFGADTNGVDEHTKRIEDSATVLSEIMDAKDRSIPRDLLQKAHCVGIVPSLKRAGFIVGAKYGKGMITCRLGEGVGWSAPSTIRIEGGNFGFQIGLGETDVIFVVMNAKGEEDLMRDKFTIGADASIMAGPLGRSTAAETDAMMRAEILAYSRSRGIFAGIALEGATLRPDNDDNRKIYGMPVMQAELLQGKVHPPGAADPLYAVLNRYAPVQTK
ncbi:MAG TPA: lipid-binding SYLF domain-containing protein [Bryobacteraceae bacterium]|jgi:lipid-binding SYLF domain-containing protein